MTNCKEIIDKVLVKHKIEQKDLAEKYGCSRAYISRVYTGKDQPSKRLINFINEMLGNGIDWVGESKPKGATHYSKMKDKFFKYDADVDK